MYWFEKKTANSYTCLEGAWMSGSHHSSVVCGIHGQPESLTLDYAAQRFYWLNSRSVYVKMETVRFDGSDR